MQFGERDEPPIVQVCYARRRREWSSANATSLRSSTFVMQGARPNEVRRTRRAPACEKATREWSSANGTSLRSSEFVMQGDKANSLAYTNLIRAKTSERCV